MERFHSSDAPFSGASPKCAKRKSAANVSPEVKTRFASGTSSSRHDGLLNWANSDGENPPRFGSQNGLKRPCAV